MLFVALDFMQLARAAANSVVFYGAVHVWKIVPHMNKVAMPGFMLWSPEHLQFSPECTWDSRPGRPGGYIDSPGFRGCTFHCTLHRAANMCTREAELSAPSYVGRGVPVREGTRSGARWGTRRVVTRQEDNSGRIVVHHEWWLPGEVYGGMYTTEDRAGRWYHLGDRDACPRYTEQLESNY